MSTNIEYNCNLNFLEGINLQVIHEDNKLIISPISDEDYHELIPDTPYIVIQMALPNIELMCILNLSILSVEVVGKGVFCKMFSFENFMNEDNSQQVDEYENNSQQVDEIKYLPCVQNCMQNADEENLLLDKFFIFCRTITQELNPLIEKVIQDPELLKLIFNEAFFKTH
jgi:hypothetical protein